MKKSFLIILVLLAAAGVYAKKQKKACSRKQKIESISMHRTACFGRCPDYIVTLNKDGMVTYTGIHFTKDSGVYQKKLSTATINKIFKQFNDYRVDTCQSNYIVRITDIPGLIYEIKYKNKTQKINNANFGPMFLKKLALSIDSAVHVDETWTKVTK